MTMDMRIVSLLENEHGPGTLVTAIAADGSQAMLRLVVEDEQLEDYKYHSIISVEVGEPRRIALLTDTGSTTSH